jgi:hypothetical protein
MKIRDGFVSNSSTTSFCIYGAYFYTEEAQKFYPELTEDDDVDGFLDDKLYNVDELELIGDPYDDGYWVGISWPNIKDDETGAQFKQRVKETLEKNGIKDVELGTHEEAWRDG